MTNEEIKKALECCNGTGPYFCDDCPYRCVGKCRDELITSAHNLITKQEQEIAKLKAAKNYWKQHYESLDQHYMALIASSVECINKKVEKAKEEIEKE